MAFKRLVVGLGLAAASSVLAAPAGAVLILDETWAADGGSQDDWSAGFDRALALGAEPQFASVIALKAPTSSCTGTWIGNDDNGHAYVLTAAHCLWMDDGSVFDWTFVTDDGTELKEVAQTMHPDYRPPWNPVSWSRAGDDIAVVELDGPIEDAGDPPVLYAGTDEEGHVATLVGYGKRGTGDLGEWPKFKADSDKAAVRNVIDWVGTPDDDSTALGFDFDRPGGADGAFAAGDAEPVDELEGGAGGGDSGGSVWIETDEGWRIAGVYAIGGQRDGSPASGSGYYLPRISSQLAFIRSVFPGVETGE